MKNFNENPYLLQLGHRVVLIYLPYLFTSHEDRNSKWWLIYIISQFGCRRVYLAAKTLVLVLKLYRAMIRK